MPIPNRPSIYLAAETAAALESSMVPQDSISGTINSIVLSYFRVLDDGKKWLKDHPLSSGEWSAIIDANNGSLIDHHAATLLWANVHDSRGFTEKWGVDVAALSDKMRALPLPAQLALADIVRLFWSDPHDDIATRVQVLLS